MSTQQFVATDDTEHTDLEATSTTAIITVFKPAEIKKATRKFAQSNLLDEGAFGSVYRGTLADGADVAIKVLKIEVQQRDAESSGGGGKFSGTAQFEREVEVLVRRAQQHRLRSRCSHRWSWHRCWSQSRNQRSTP